MIYDFPFKVTKTNTNIKIINTNTNSHDWDELDLEKKMENEVEQDYEAIRGSWARPWEGWLSEAVRGWLTGRVWDGWGIWQMGKGDERDRGLCDRVRSVIVRTKQSWESKELCLCLTACGLVAVSVRELRDEEREAAVWVRELRDEEWV